MSKMHKSDSRTSMISTASKDTLRDSKAGRKLTLNKKQFMHTFSETNKLNEDKIREYGKDITQLKANLQKHVDFI
jgi:hypothetical protein